MQLSGLNQTINGFMNISTMSKIYWFTGQPGAGKTVLAKLLQARFEWMRQDVFHIDGDDLRDLIQNKDYSKEGRIKNIELAQSIAKYLYNKNNNVVVSLVSPYLDIREKFKQDMGADIVEIYVHTTDIRGREQFHVPDYEVPTSNFISIDTTGKTDIESFKHLLTQI
jgi:adenylylsulfate kinase-like enzyme